MRGEVVACLGDTHTLRTREQSTNHVMRGRCASQQALASPRRTLPHRYQAASDPAREAACLVASLRIAASHILQLQRTLQRQVRHHTKPHHAQHSNQWHGLHVVKPYRRLHGSQKPETRAMNGRVSV